MKMLEKLNAMRAHGGPIQTHGLDDETVLRFAQLDERLGEAVDAAYTDFLALKEEMPELMALPENELAAGSRTVLSIFTRSMRSTPTWRWQAVGPGSYLRAARCFLNAVVTVCSVLDTRPKVRSKP